MHKQNVQKAVPPLAFALINHKQDSLKRRKRKESSTESKLQLALNNTTLNCTDPPIHGFFPVVNATVPQNLWLVESWMWNCGYRGAAPALSVLNGGTCPESLPSYPSVLHREADSRAS